MRACVRDLYFQPHQRLFECHALCGKKDSHNVYMCERACACVLACVSYTLSHSSAYLSAMLCGKKDNHSVYMCERACACAHACVSCTLSLQLLLQCHALCGCHKGIHVIWHVHARMCCAFSHASSCLSAMVCGRTLITYVCKRAYVCM